MAELILIVDDDPVQRRLLEAHGAPLRLRRDRRPRAATRRSRLLTGPDGGRIDCVILDLVMPDLDGYGVLARMRDAGLEHSGDRADRAWRHRQRSSRRCAPARSISSSSRSAPSGCRSRCAMRSTPSALEAEFQRLKRSRAGTLTFKDIVTRSARMQAVLRTAEKAAASLIPVLIEGESGVGKELIARAIHGSGERRAKPFVAVNCGAIPDNLVESILFGHEKGAFTGATEKHIGKFVEASGGTLFLDEVGELPPAAQVKLLRAIQEGEVDPVGGAQAGQGRRAHHLGDQPQPDRRREERALPRGPVLPPARVSDHGAAAARAAGGHPGSGAPFPRALRRRGRKAHPRRLGRRARAAQRASLARQCAAARERGVPRGGARRRRRDRRERIPAARARTRAYRHRRSRRPTKCRSERTAAPLILEEAPATSPHAASRAASRRQTRCRCSMPPARSVRSRNSKPR